jgi:hypothetical protein
MLPAFNLPPKLFVSAIKEVDDAAFDQESSLAGVAS